jgi:hypothetical protein
VGWLLAVRSGEWPARTATLVFLDDLVWWIPFAAFLLRGTRVASRAWRLAPWLCAGANLVASAFLALALRGGTEVEGDPAARRAFVEGHLGLWRAGWLVWTAAASALIAFYAWWSVRAGRPRLALLGFAVGAAGLFFDFTAESLFVAWLPERMDLQRVGSVLSGAVANSGYVAGGALLTIATPGLGPRLRAWAWATWAAGASLSVSAAVGSVPAMVASTAATMASFVPLAVAIGRRLS